MKKQTPDSESKEAGEDAESDKEVKKGSEKKLPGFLQNQNQVREFYFFKLVWRLMLKPIQMIPSPG